jgi:hypothetical protein
MALARRAPASRRTSSIYASPAYLGSTALATGVQPIFA